MTAIMQIGDYISSKTVQELTPAQYQKFREYLRQCGYSMDPKYGLYDYSSNRNNFAQLDHDGDLSWCCYKGTGKEITADEIFKVIQTNDEDFVMTTDKYKSERSSSIMQFGDYISRKTIQELTCDQYDEFRLYLRQFGYSVDPKYGVYNYQSKRTQFVELDRDGDLSWCYKGNGKEITANEILAAIQSMKSLTTSKYFVMHICNSIPDVNYDAKMFVTEELVRAAAEKLAKENPTQKFCVLKCCGVVQSRSIEWN